MSELKPEPRKKRKQILTAGIAGVALAVNLFIVSRTVKPETLSAEAIVRSSIARELSGEDSRGYHALISSSLMAPLPTLGAAPLVCVKGWQNGFAFYILNAFCAAIATVYMISLARSLSLPLAWLWGLALAAGLLYNSWTPLAAWRGTCATGSLMFATAIGAHFASWLKTGKWVSLGWSANLLAFAVIWDVRFAPVALLGAAIVAGHAGALARRERRAAIRAAKEADDAKAAADAAAGSTPPPAVALMPGVVPPRAVGKGRVEGSLVVFLSPILYIPGIWVLFNWLIFGDVKRVFHDLVFFKELVLHFAKYGAAALVVCYLATRFVPLGRVAAAALYGVGVAGLVWLAMTPVSPAMAAIVGTNTTTPSYPQTLDDLRRYLRESHGGKLTLVIGRPGYLLKQHLGACTQYIHNLDLNIETILHDSPGRDLVLLLSEPQRERFYAEFGKERWDRFFLPDERFGPWQAFICLRSVTGRLAPVKSSGTPE